MIISAMLKTGTNAEIKSATLKTSQMNRIAKRLFSLNDWTEKYGKPVYYLRTAEGVRKILNEKNIADEWDIYSHGYRCFIFLSKEKQGKIENQSQIKLSPAAIEKIDDADFSVRGSQRKLAKELGVHECHVSRIRRGERRPERIESKHLSIEEKKRLFVSRKEVIEFFDQVLTAKELFANHRREFKLYKLSDVYKLCASRKKLPADWHKIRVGETWFFYNLPTEL
jgi:transcriptional regulator with XRE-family HTH domain